MSRMIVPAAAAMLFTFLGAVTTAASGQARLHGGWRPRFTAPHVAWTTLPTLKPPEQLQIAARFPIQQASSVAVGAGGVWLPSARPNAVVELDARSGHVETRIRLGTKIDVLHPFSVAVGAGSVWVLDRSRGMLYRIDPRRRSLAARIRVGEPADDLAVGEGAVWVAKYLDEVVVRIDPRTGRRVGAIPTASPRSLTVGLGAVWVTSTERGTVSRIDPRTNRIVSVTRVRGASAVAAGGGAIWVANHDGTVVSRLSPAAGAVVVRVTLRGGSAPASLAIGGGFLWAIGGTCACGVNPPEPRGFRVDPRTNRVTGSIVFPIAVDQVAVGEGSAWVRSKDGNDLFRLPLAP